MRLVNTFEGGSDETTITAGNSGGSSGDAFNTVVTGSGVTNVFDNAQAMHGSFSARQATGGTSAQAILTWSYSSVSRIYGRVYVRFSNVTTARSLVQIRASNSQRARIALTAASKIALNDAANNAVDTSATSVSVDTWYRLEYDIAVGTSATGTVNLYVGDSLTLTEAITGTGDFNAVNFDETRHGQIANAANLPSMWLDGLDTNDVALPGPYLQTVTPNAIASAETVHQPAISSTATITPNAIGSAEVVHQPALTSTATIAPNAIGSAETVYQPALSQDGGGQTISPNAVSSAEVVHQPALSSTATITPNAVASAEVIHAPALTSTATITPASIASSEVVHQPSLTSVATIAANAIASASTVYPPSLASVATILAGFIASAAQVYQPALTGGGPSTIARPNTGTITRPGTGVITRPNTGVITRP
jgi:hypothetical protein